MKKKIIIIALTVLILLGTKVEAQTFKDMKKHWAKEQIEWAVNKKLFMDIQMEHLNLKERQQELSFLQ